LSEFDPKAFLATLPNKPGCYQMYDSAGELLYVGKAKNLKNRVSSYFRETGLSIKTRALVSKIQSIEITSTGSETEALLLEQNLIKQYRPPYNILLRDDKSYPYILITDKDSYPAVRYQRGKRSPKGTLFGPFPSGGAVKESLNLLQKLFKVRQCDDSFFRNRSRPCLQYQIERCSAPCVGLVDDADYQRDVRHTKLFLQGKNPKVMSELASEMEAASSQLEFEKAAQLRDQLARLQHVQEQQAVTGQKGEADVFGVAVQPGGVCVHALFVRQGRVVGSKVYFPRVAIEDNADDVLSAFIAQFYLAGGREIPETIITAIDLSESGLLSDALSQMRERTISITSKVRAERSSWLKLAQQNAEQNLQSQLANKQNIYNRFLDLQSALGMEEVPSRLECFDISHSSGEATVASCVVFDRNGPLKRDYRKYNIEGITGGDDYAAMNQALHRRFEKATSVDAILPDILVIDGGKGQVAQAVEVLNELNIHGIKVIGIAKGPTRKAGFEILIDAETGTENILESDSLALHLLQHIRDESHRFAITGHRARRAKARKQSLLEGIDGIGPKRRKELLKHFGSAKGVESASVEEIAKVSSISHSLAETIYLALHPDS
jgi:excinuclease ABC subunit C